MSTLTPTLVLLSIGISSFLTTAFAAQEAPQQFAFEGRLYQIDGSTPLTDTVNFKFQILNQNTSGNPVNDCILYEESQNGINLGLTSGVFSLAIGAAQSGAKRTVSDPGLALSQIFSNATTITVPASVCPAGFYSPSAGSIRRLRVIVTNTNTGVTETMSPDLIVGSTPSALVSETLQGKVPQDFVMADGSTNMTAGLKFGTWASSGRPSSPLAGTTGFNTTTGYLESWNGSAWVDYSAGSGGGALSGLTAGRVPFATSSTAVADDSNLFWDNTNKRLGIGTGTPAESLEISGNFQLQNGRAIYAKNSSSTPHKIVNYTAGNILKIGEDVNDIRIGNGGTTGGLCFFGNAQYFNTGSGFTMTATSDGLSINNGSSGPGAGVGLLVATGKVGIGTITPSATLDISGTNAGGTLRIFDQTVTTGVTKQILQAGAGQSSTNLFEIKNNAGTTLSYIDSSGYFFQPGAPTANTLRAATTAYVDSAVSGASSTAITKDGLTPLTGDWDVSGGGSKNIKNVAQLSVGSTTLPTGGVAYFNGNVGIGTTNPTSNLSVIANNGAELKVGASGGTGGSAIRLVGSNSGTLSTVNIETNWTGGLSLSGNGFYFGSGFGNPAGGATLQVGGNAAIGSSYTANATAAPSNGLIVQGNVGIGTTSPGRALDVNGSANLRGGILDLSPGGTQAVGLKVSGNTALLLNSNGSNEGAALYMQGNWNLRGDTGTIGFVSGSNPANPPETALSRLAANKMALGNGNVGDYSGTLIAGNIGIGTTSPATALHVVGSGTSGAEVFRVSDPPFPGSYISLYGNAGSGHAGIKTNSNLLDLSLVTIGGTGGGASPSLKVRATQSGSLVQSWQNYAGTNLMTIDSSGNLTLTGSINGVAVGGGPNAFNFTNQTGVNLNSTITSNAVTLSGFSGIVPAVCAGCVGILRNGYPVGVSGNFKSGDTIAIQILSSSSATTAVTASVTVGSTTSTIWSVTTGSAAGNAPQPFSFTDQTNVILNSGIISNVVFVSGFTGTLTATCNGGCSDISVNGVWAGATSVAGVFAGNQIRIKQTSSASTSTATTGSLTLGGTTSGTWTVTTAATSDPCDGSPAVGTMCADGSLYAGLSPDGNVKMFTTPCDVGMTWNGTVCTGVRSGFSWNDGSTNYVVTGAASATSGKTNTDQLVALGTSPSPAPYLAARQCGTNLVLGHGDWYLPAKDELNVLYTNKAVLGGFDTSGAVYWASTEATFNHGWRQWFSDGTQSGGDKNVSWFVIRCVRK